MTWQIARQQECATVWCQLAGSGGELIALVERCIGGRSAWIARDGMLSLVAALRKMQREAKRSKTRHLDPISSN